MIKVVTPEEQTFRNQLGRRLNARRNWLQLSQDDIANKAGVTRNFVSAIERGAQGLDAWRLHLVADAVGVTLDWLLFGPDELLTDPEPGHATWLRLGRSATDSMAPPPD